MKKYFFLLATASAIFMGCIKDDIIEDFVEPTLKITTLPDSILLNSTYQFGYQFLNNIGVAEDINVQWSSGDPSIIEIDNSGLAFAKALGKTDITVEYSTPETNLSHSKSVNVGMSTVDTPIEKSGFIKTTSSYALEGEFTLKTDGNNLILEFMDNYKASSALPGLYVYLSNNKNTIANALEISAVETFSGAHSYTIDNVSINDFDYLVYFCKPFNVKVGDGDIE